MAPLPIYRYWQAHRSYHSQIILSFVGGHCAPYAKLFGKRFLARCLTQLQEKSTIIDNIPRKGLPCQ